MQTARNTRNTKGGLTAIKWTLLAALAVFLLLGGLAGVLVLVSPQFELSPWRESIAARIGQLTGYEMRIDGSITLALGRHLQVQVTDVRVENPQWAGPDPLFRAAELAARLDLLPLFSGVLHVEEVVLHDAALVLAVSETGEQSWTRRGTPASASRSHGTDSRWRPVLERAEVEQVSLRYRKSCDNQSQYLRIDRFIQRNDSGMLVVGGSGGANGKPFNVAGRIGPLQSLLENRDVVVDLEAGLGETAASVQGRLGSPALLEDLDLSASLKGPSMAALLATFGIESADPGDIDLDVTVTDLEHGFAWQSSGHLGEIRLETAGSLEQPLQLDDLRLSIDMQGNDLSLLGRLVGSPTMPSQPFRLRGNVKHDSPELILQDITLETGPSRFRLSGVLPEFPAFDGAQASMELSMPNPSSLIPALGDMGPVVAPLRVTAGLAAGDSGRERLSVEVHMGRNRLLLNGPLGNYPAYQGTQLEFTLSGPDLASLATPAGLAGLPETQFGFNGRLAVDDERIAKLRLDEGHAGDLRIQAQASLGRLPVPETADLSVLLSGKSLNTAAAGIAGRPLPDQPFELRGRLQGKIAAPVLSEVGARIGDARLKVNGVVGLPPRFAGTDARFDLNIPALGQLLPEPSAAAWTGNRLRLKGRVEGGDRVMKLHGVTIEGEGMRGTLEAALPVPFQEAGIRLALTVTAPELATVLPALNSYQPPHAPLNADVVLVTKPGGLDFERLKVGLADARLTGKGGTRKATDGNVMALDLTMSGKRLSALGTFGTTRLPDDAFRIEAGVKQGPRRTDIQNLQARIGNARVSGSASIDIADRPRVELSASMSNLDLGRYLAQAPTKATSRRTGDSGANKTRRLIPNEAPSLDFLGELDGRFRINGKALTYPDPAFAGSNLVSEAELDAALDGGKLELHRLRIAGERGEYNISGMLDRSRPNLSSRLTLNFERFRFGLLARGQELTQLPQHELDVSLSASGRTYRELAASLNGKIRMHGGEGKTLNAGLDKVLGSFTQELLAIVNPFSKEDEYTYIVCSAAALELVNGVLRLQPGFVTRTDKMDISATGTIDLRNETNNVYFKNSPRKGLGLSAAGLVNPFVKVGGTLAEPGIEIAKTKALVSGTAAVATGGLSLLAQGLLDRATSTAINPCEQVVRAAQEGR